MSDWNMLMAYTVRVERGIALGRNDRSGNMAV